MHLTLAPDPTNDPPHRHRSWRWGGGDKEKGDDAKTPLTRLMGRGDRVWLLQLLDLEDEWERARQEECCDGE